MAVRKVKPIYGAIAFMAALSTAWLGYEFWRLLWQPVADNGAVDLLYRYEEVTSFVSGIPVYWHLSDAVYPPASYLMMWPLIGWLPEWAVRPVWAITTIVCLALIVVQIFHITQPQQLATKVFLALLPLCLYATGATIGNGQIVIHLLPCLLGSFLLLQQTLPTQKALPAQKTSAQNITWQSRGILSLLMLLALVKPNVAAPFFWILVFKTPLCAALTATSYGLLTLFSTVFQPEFDGPIHLFKAWLNMGMAGVYYGATPYVEYEGGGSIASSVTAHSAIGWLNFDQLDFVEFSGWNQSVSLAMLFVLGIWTYRNRDRNIWILASVAAIVSKYWTYHGWYDDLVLLVPMLVLFQLSHWESRSQPVDKQINKKRTYARVLFVAMFVVMLAPGGSYLFEQPWRSLYLILQTVVIFSTLLFLTCGVKLKSSVQASKDSLQKRSAKSIQS